MDAETLKPQVIHVPRVVTPQCCVSVNDPTHNAGWRQERYKKLRPSFDPGRCQHESVFKLDGKCYCRSHAGIYCLEKWLAGDLVGKEELSAPGATDAHPEAETLAGDPPLSGDEANDNSRYAAEDNAIMQRWENGVLDKAISAIRACSDPVELQGTYVMMGPAGILRLAIGAVEKLKGKANG